MMHLLVRVPVEAVSDETPAFMEIYFRIESQMVQRESHRTAGDKCIIEFHEYT